MKIIVVSDSHGKNKRLVEVLELHPDADMYLHCGDIETDDHEFPMYQTVMGNNDYFYDYPNQIFLKAQNHRIVVIHGHQFMYLKRNEKLVAYAKEHDCDIVCYGHSHVAHAEVIDGVLLLNPGSLWRSRDGREPSYAILNIDKDNVQSEIIFLER